MKITPVRNISYKTLQKAKNIKNHIPKKVTVDNLPAVATTLGLLSPIPFGWLIFGAIGKAAQIVIKKTLHKP